MVPIEWYKTPIYINQTKLIDQNSINKTVGIPTHNK